MHTPASVAKHPIHPIAGIIGGIVAAVPGFIDMLSLPWPVKRIALIHMTINLSIVVGYILNAIFLRSVGSTTDGGVILSICLIVLLAISGWLGGKMVYVHGVAVETPPEPAKSSDRRPSHA